ncbi:MAG: hypothetical protein C0456_02925 [Hyphomonas sp.]|nr:hypothetical protein [Hyphomonas sp.]
MNMALFSNVGSIIRVPRKNIPANDECYDQAKTYQECQQCKHGRWAYRLALGVQLGRAYLAFRRRGGRTGIFRGRYMGHVMLLRCVGRTAAPLICCVKYL